MKIRSALSVSGLLLLWFVPLTFAQQKLTLAQAEQIALSNQPLLRAAHFSTLAAREQVTEARSAFFPVIQGNATAVDAQKATRIAAGVLNNPSVFERYSNGLTVNQLITDFGRTANLTGSASESAKAQAQTEETERQEILLQVDTAFFNALRAQAVVQVSKQTVDERQVLVDQVSALANAKLKSGLDLSFANVALSQAKLDFVKAQNDLQSAFADLSAAMGYPSLRSFDLIADHDQTAPPPAVDGLLKLAMSDRPEIKAQEFRLNAARKFQTAERDLSFPTVSAVAAGGLTPTGDPVFRSHYGAAGVNLNIPIFNGFLFFARNKQAQYEEEVEQQRLTDLQNGVARDVRVAWLNANTAYQRLGLTAELLAQTSQALDLAQARYKLGLGSIVELSQAQLNQTQAQIEQSTAAYDYQARLAVLKRVVGGF